MTTVEHEHGGWLGRSVKRKEDDRFIVGRGNYIEDIKLPNMLHMAILRSPYAHATINSIDTSRATELPGVVAVVTGELLAQHMDEQEPRLDLERALAPIHRHRDPVRRPLRLGDHWFFSSISFMTPSTVSSPDTRSPPTNSTGMPRRSM